MCVVWANICSLMCFSPNAGLILHLLFGEMLFCKKGCENCFRWPADISYRLSYTVRKSHKAVSVRNWRKCPNSGFRGKLWWQIVYVFQRLDETKKPQQTFQMKHTSHIQLSDLSPKTLYIRWQLNPITSVSQKDSLHFRWGYLFKWLFKNTRGRNFGAEWG